MPQNCIYLKEANNPASVPFTAGQFFDTGDLVALVSGKAYTAKNFTFSGGASSFATALLGHCFQYLPSGGNQVYGNSSSGVIGVSTAGVYRAPLQAATTLVVGDWVSIGVQYTASGANILSGALLSQYVDKINAGSGGAAIGVVVKAETNATYADFRLLSSKLPAAR